MPKCAHLGASCAFLAGCGENDREEQMTGQQEEQEGETWKPMTVSDTEKKEAETSVKEAAEAYEGIYPYKENGKAISEKDRKQVIKAMGEKQIAAVDADGLVGVYGRVEWDSLVGHARVGRVRQEELGRRRFDGKRGEPCLYFIRDGEWKNDTGFWRDAFSRERRG